MSGHNKWAQIKRKKGVTDAKKSKIFAMISKKITVESRLAKGDKNSPSLRKMIETAKASNMPNDKIDAAVAKGTGAGGIEMTKVTYEAYGPGGSAIIIEGISDNKNRTSQEMKHLLSKNGLELSPQGSVILAFRKEGDEWVANVPMELSDEDAKVLETLLEQLDEHQDVEDVFTNVNFKEE